MGEVSCGQRVRDARNVNMTIKHVGLVTGEVATLDDLGILVALSLEDGQLSFLISIRGFVASQ